MIVVWKRMGWLVVFVGIVGPLLAETALDFMIGDGAYASSYPYRCLGAGLGSLLIYIVGRWLNDPARLEVRNEETNEVVGVRSEHTFCFVPFQQWAFIFPVLYFFF